MHSSTFHRRCLVSLLCLLGLSYCSSFSGLARSRSTRLLRASASEDLVFSQEFSDSIAEEVQKKVKIPFVPDPVVTYVLSRAVQNMSSDLSQDTLKRVLELAQTEATATKYDDMSKEELDSLADQVAKELNPTIDVPMLDETQEYEVLRQIMRVVFSIMTTSESDARKKRIKTELEVSHDLLTSEESRAKLVEAINAAVDVPILDESQEERVLSVAVASCAETLQTLLPPELIETLKGESPDAIAEMKEYLITTVNERVDLVGLSEDQERILIETMVQILIDTYVDETEAEFLLLTQDEQREELMQRQALLEYQMEVSQRKYEREQKNLGAKIDRINERLKALGSPKKTKATKPASNDSSGRFFVRSFFRKS